MNAMSTRRATRSLEPETQRGSPTWSRRWAAIARSRGYSTVAIPCALLFPGDALAQAIVAEAASSSRRDDDIVVTGARDVGYNASDATGGTKMPVKLLDVPLSIQVVNRAVIDDLGAVRSAEVVQYVSGVYAGNPPQFGGESFLMRGFEANDFLRDGYLDRSRSMRETANVERMEVLKGPASVLYGRVEPGGTLNYVTKRPLAQSQASATARIDSFGLARVTGDISVTDSSGTLGLRVNGAGETGGNFRDFTFSDRAFGSAALVWKLSPDTQISADFEYLYDRRSPDRTGIPLLNGTPAPIPIERMITEPSDFREVRQMIAGYTIEHRLNDDWRIKHALRFNRTTTDSERTQVRTSSLSPTVVTTVDPATGEIDRYLRTEKIDPTELTTQVELIGRTDFGGGIAQDILVGTEFDDFKNERDEFSATQSLAVNRINIFNPVYGMLQPIGLRQSTLSEERIKSWAVYAQSMIELGTRWNVLLGARYDVARSSTDNFLRDTKTAADTKALSPRAGIVWHPTASSSLYASYSQSFVPVIGQDFAGNLFDPTIGKQIEAGAKSEWFDGRLGATLAVFRIEKQNVTADDPVNDGFDTQTGAIESKGVEFDVTGSPLKGLSIMANAAYTKARITKDSRPALIGQSSTDNNMPRWGGGVWASYELQDERLKGLGGGLGVVRVGDRRNSNGGGSDYHVLPAYTRADMNLWYRKAGWRISAKLENLLDRRYWSAGSHLGVRPGAPRNVTISASRSW